MPGNVVDFDEALSLTITSRKVGDLATNLFSKEQLGGRSGRQSLLIASQSPEQHAMISDLAIPIGLTFQTIFTNFNTKTA